MAWMQGRMGFIVTYTLHWREAQDMVRSLRMYE